MTTPQYIECQACSRTVNSIVTTCPYCGSDPGGGLEDLAPAEPESATTKRDRSRYRTIGSVGLFLQLLFGLYGAGSLVSALTAWQYRELLLDIDAGRPLVLTDASLIEDRYIMAAGVTAAVYLILGVAFVVWFWRAYSNLTVLGRRRKRRAGWAIGAWFVPFANLVMPYSIGAEIWRQSNPGSARSPASQEQSMEPVISWWALFLITTVVNQIALLSSGDLTGDPGRVAGGVGVDLVGSVIGIAAAVAALRFVRIATERQDRLAAAVGVA